MPPRLKRGKCFLCERPCSGRCEQCSLVFCCSKDHYLSHQQRGYCFPYRVSWSSSAEGIGRLVATRDIKPLELMLFEWSLVVGPNSNMVCADCCRILPEPPQVYRCGMCSIPLCGDRCQVGRNHYSECQLFRMVKDAPFFRKTHPSIVTKAILPIRLLKVIDIGVL